MKKLISRSIVISLIAAIVQSLMLSFVAISLGMSAILFFGNAVIIFIITFLACLLGHYVIKEVEQ